MNSIIAQLDDVHLIYHEPRGETEAVGGISLSVHKGEFVSIVGPSGCGKTSLLSIFAGILQPSSGKAEVLGAPPDPRANSTGYMLQRDHLFDWRTIEQNALLGLEVKKRLNAETHAYAAELLDRYGLGAFKDYYPRQLSGGMKQKAAREPIGFNLLPKLFTLSRLQSLYEAIYGEAMDKRNFRKRVADMDYIEKTDKIDKESSKRGAALYKFNANAYNRTHTKFKL